MNNEEHYFANLLYDGDDEVAGNHHKDNIKPEIRETIEMCYEYVIKNIFKNRKNLNDYIESINQQNYRT